jgi:hypothetical protein
LASLRHLDTQKYIRPLLPAAYGVAT